MTGLISGVIVFVGDEAPSRVTFYETEDVLHIACCVFVMNHCIYAFNYCHIFKWMLGKLPFFPIVPIFYRHALA